MNFKNKIDHITVAVDLQRDFFTQIGEYNGSLGVGGADELYAKKCYDFLSQKKSEDGFIIATQDYHPSGHVSFASTHNGNLFEQFKLEDGRTQVLWPDHCIQGTLGAELVPEVFSQINIGKVFQKGTDLDVDSYGGILSDIGPDGKRRETGLGNFLKGAISNNIEGLEFDLQVIQIIGLAFDYCVGTTAIQIKDLLKKIDSKVCVIVFSEFCRSVSLDSHLKMVESLSENEIILI